MLDIFKLKTKFIKKEYSFGTQVISVNLFFCYSIYNILTWVFLLGERMLVLLVNTVKICLSYEKLRNPT